MCWSAGSAVVGIDAAWRPADGDFTDEPDVQVEVLGGAQIRPHAVVAGVVSTVQGEVGDQLGSLSQVRPQSPVLIETAVALPGSHRQWCAEGGWVRVLAGASSERRPYRRPC